MSKAAMTIKTPITTHANLMSIECHQALPGTNSPQSEPILYPNIRGAHCYRDGDGLNLVEHDSAVNIALCRAGNPSH